MNLIEFIKHPAYNYYITTLVHDCLLSDLTNVFDYNLLKYIKKPNFATNTIDYIISANIDIADEWCRISFDGTCQNRRKGNVFKEPDGSIRYNGAFSKRVTDTYNFDTKEWTKNKNPICWHGGLFECKNNVLTGRYFNTCYLQQRDIIND